MLLIIVLLNYLFKIKKKILLAKILLVEQRKKGVLILLFSTHEICGFIYLFIYCEIWINDNETYANKNLVNLENLILIPFLVNLKNEREFSKA